MTKSGLTAIQAIQWVGWADEDYVCARVLLLSGSVVQGSILSNTAIEKYLKGGLVVRGAQVPRSHDVVSLCDKLKNTGTVAPINEQYLSVLVKAYKMRYPDDLQVGFNIALNQAKMLSELDATVHKLRAGFHFTQNGKPASPRLQHLLQQNDPRALEGNTAFGAVKREQLFKQPSHSYDLRVLSDEHIREAEYISETVTDDGIFEIEGMKQLSDTKFQLAYPPILRPPADNDVK